MRRVEKYQKIHVTKHVCLGGVLYMDKIILFHGSPNEKVTPHFGLGNEKHDYGKGFYLTESLDLAKEWAVYRPEESNGWVHKFELDTEGLKILDFQENLLKSMELIPMDMMWLRDGEQMLRIFI